MTLSPFLLRKADDVGHAACIFCEIAYGSVLSVLSVTGKIKQLIGLTYFSVDAILTITATLLEIVLLHIYFNRLPRKRLDIINRLYAVPQVLLRLG